MEPTAKQLEEFISKHFEKQEKKNDYYEYSFWEGEYPELETPWGKLEFVETYPDSPGDGRFWGSVWKLGDRFFIQGGYYSSWDSSEFDGEFEEVEQRPKEIMVYYRKGSNYEIG